MATTMTKEEAVGMVKLLSSKSPEHLSDFENELMNVALDVMDRAESDSLKTNINQGDIKELTKHWDFLQNIDVESHGDVKKAQKILKEYGYYKGEVDSFYGDQTKDARARMASDIINHPKFIPNMLIEQAKGLFDFGDN